MSDGFERFVLSRLPVCSMPVTAAAFVLSHPMRGVQAYIAAAVGVAGVYLLLELLLPRRLVYLTDRGSDANPLPADWENTLLRLELAAAEISGKPFRAKLETCIGLCRRLAGAKNSLDRDTVSVLSRLSLPAAADLAVTYAKLEGELCDGNRPTLDAIDDAFDRLNISLQNVLQDAGGRERLHVKAEAKALCRMLTVCGIAPTDT